MIHNVIVRTPVLNQVCPYYNDDSNAHRSFALFFRQFQGGGSHSRTLLPDGYAALPVPKLFTRFQIVPIYKCIRNVDNTRHIIYVGHAIFVQLDTYNSYYTHVCSPWYRTGKTYGGTINICFSKFNAHIRIDSFLLADRKSSRAHRRGAVRSSAECDHVWNTNRLYTR